MSNKFFNTLRLKNSEKNEERNTTMRGIQREAIFFILFSLLFLYNSDEICLN